MKILKRPTARETNHTPRYVHNAGHVASALGRIYRLQGRDKVHPLLNASDDLFTRRRTTGPDATRLPLFARKIDPFGHYCSLSRLPSLYLPLVPLVLHEENNVMTIFVEREELKENEALPQEAIDCQLHRLEED
jgi:hypothetical protein